MIESTIMTALDGNAEPEIVVRGTDQEPDTLAPVAAVILAAGGSTRMGKPKQLLALQDEPMLRRVTRAVCAANLNQVVVVIGAQAQAVEQAVSGLNVDLVVNKA